MQDVWMSNKNVMTGGRYGGIGGQWTQLMAFIYMHKPSYTNFCFFMISRGNSSILRVWYHNQL